MVEVRDITLWDDFELVREVIDEKSGLRAWIGIHNTNLGPAVGGIRYYAYGSDEEAQADLRKLAIGMTHKNSMAGLDAGGGKTVINASGIKDRARAYRVLGEAIDTLQGKYWGASDVGTTPNDLKVASENTKYIGGLDIDSSTPTSVALYQAQQTFCDFYGLDFTSQRFVFEGLGKVASKTIKLLQDAGVEWIEGYDVYEPAWNNVEKVTEVNANQVYTNTNDIFAPCALGGSLSIEHMAKRGWNFVVGAANNQFKDESSIEYARLQGIKYVPDFIANCGGVIGIVGGMFGIPEPEQKRKLTVELDVRIKELLERADKEDVAAQIMAETLAMERVNS